MPGTSPTADTSGHVWYAGADQGVHELYWGGSTWVDSNWTASSGSGLLTAQGTSFSTDNQGTLYYISGNQDVQQMFWGGSRYLDADLMASSGSGSTAYVPRNATVQNLTNPAWGASFNVGDTMSVTVTGPANMPVSLSQSPGGTTQMGYTNANGVFTYSAVENTSNIGSYTQVWSVGTTAASPSISYLVGQLGNPGTISTTSTAQSEGDYVTGISTLSITNGYINTYSATELNYNANLYYDSGTVATLFDDEGQVSQESGNYFAMMSGNTNAWDDYSLQTDHYVEAFDNSGVYYNPLYFGEGGCDGDIEDGTDCTLGSGGEGAYVLAEAELYLGSTVAFQTDIPQDGSLALVSDSAYDSFFQSAQQPVKDPPELRSWKIALSSIAPALFVIRSEWANDNPTNPTQYRLPYMLVLMDDSQNPPPSGNNNNQRVRQYLLEDTYGDAWPLSNPVKISEKFAYVDGSLASMPVPNNPSTGGTPWSNPGDMVNGKFEDEYGFYMSGQPPVLYLQFYWAWGFATPQGFSLPTLPTLSGVNDGSLKGMSGPAVPLMIKSKNVNTNFQNCAMYGAQGVYLTQQYVWINGQATPSLTSPGCPKTLGDF